MKIEQICVSLELAKQLKEAGYPQESLFYVDEASKQTTYPNTEFRKIIREVDGKLTNTEYFSSPTASELLEELPNYISDTPDGFYLHIAKWHEEIEKEPYQCFYKPAKGNVKRAFENFAEFRGNTTQDALAKMWLYLKQNNLLTK